MVGWIQRGTWAVTLKGDEDMAGKRDPQRLSGLQLAAVVILRVAVGWHFLYEGAVKLFDPEWTAERYLASSSWLFSGMFHWMASSPGILRVVDFMNVWGLILIGLGLLFGCFARAASVSGIVLLLLYYVANPPFTAAATYAPMEGSYLFVDKNLVEMFALCVLVAIPSSRYFGLDRFIGRLLPGRSSAAPAQASTMAPARHADPAPCDSPMRRDFVKSLATVPFAAAFGFALCKRRPWKSYEEKSLADAVTSATIKKFDFSTLDDLKGRIPTAKIGNVTLSRMMLGGNLIGGWAHSRDLIYVSSLVKAYHHDQKVFETFALAEKCGINTIMTNPALCRVITEYWERGLGKIQFISDCGGANLIEGAQTSIDSGACACYLHGGVADNLVREGKFDEMAKVLDLIRQNGLPAGIGGHYLETVKGCVEHGLEPDFWMKTLHPANYWSASIPTECDNIWSRTPEETAAFMKTIQKPWIAFKTLAAGAVLPQDGFRYAFESGADFICVGMYDFQIVDDANLCLNILNGGLKRERPWIA